MRLFYAFIFVLPLLASHTGHADEDSYQITYVYDGDTIKIRNANGEFKLRLSDIDTPERDQNFGLKSRRALSKLCIGNKIHLKITLNGKDKYMRSLGKLECNKTDVSLYLIRLGLAWHYSQYSNDPTLRDAEIKARLQKRGLWADHAPIAPWIWRYRQIQ